MVFVFFSSAIANFTDSKKDTTKTGTLPYFKSYVYDGVDFLTFYRSWTPSEWAVFSGIAIGGTVSSFYDRDINSYVRRSQNNYFDAASKYFFDPVGGYKLFGGLILYTSIAYGTGHTVRQETGLNAIKAGMISTAAFMTLKNVIQRPRPYVNKGYPTKTVFFERDFQSFPSGHASNAFAVAAVFSDSYKDNYKAVPYISYGLAGLIAFSRVYNQEHYLSDVLAGATLGYIVGKTVARKNNWFFGDISLF